MMYDPILPHHEHEKPKTGFFKQFFFWIFLFVFTGGFIVTASEVVLRIMPGQWSNTFFHVYDPVIGTWHIADHVGEYKSGSGDFHTRAIHTNTFGMRDRERTLAKTEGVIRIAVLGDSFVEAFHVEDEETFTRLIETRGAEKIEVLNFGVAGLGTTQELLVYRERVRQFDPDIVLLGFLPSNDMRNNSRSLEDAYTGTTNPDRPFADLFGTSTYVITPPTPKPSATNPALLFIKKHFTLYRFLWYQKGVLTARYATAPVTPADVATTSVGDVSLASTTEKKPESVNAYLTKLYAPPKEEPFIGAWKVTEWSIRELRKDVEADGAKFVLVVLPDATPMEKDSKAVLEEEYGEVIASNFDVDYPAKRLKKFAETEKMFFLDLTPVFRAERDREKLTRPYFSYEHDGHWSAKGHIVAAEGIYSYLKAKKFVP